MSQLILLLEDDLALRDQIATTLTQRNFDVIHVARATQAFDILKRTAVDLIVLDSLLSDMNGIDFIAQLRFEGVITPILFMSAFPTLLEDNRTLKMLTHELGVSRILSKPFQLQELLFHVEVLLADEKERHEEAVDDGSFRTQPLPVVELEEDISLFLEEHPPGALPPQMSYREEGVRVEEDAAALPPQPHRTRTRKQRDVSGWDDAAFRTEVEKKLDDDLVRIDLQKLRERFKLSKQIQSKAHVLREARSLAKVLSKSIGVTPHLQGLSQVAALLQQLEQSYQEGTLDSANPLWMEIDGLLRGVTFAHREFMQAQLEQKPRGDIVAKLLLVDEDPSALIGRLHNEQTALFQLFPARSLEEAEKCLEEYDIDVVFVRIKAGDESGIRTARLLRTTPGYAELPIAFLSSDASMDMRVQASQLEKTLFLSAPFEVDELVKAIQQLLLHRKNGQHRVLLVDDDNDRANQALQILTQAGMKVHWVDRPGDVLSVLEETRPDAVLLEVSTAILGGVDLCKMLRAAPLWQGLPLFLLSEHDKDSLRIAAFEAGADDFLVRPLRKQELLTRIESRIARTRSQRESLYRDPLTGLIKKAAALYALHARYSEALRNQKTLALCMIDVDHLKQINKGYDDLSGDNVLASLGRLIRLGCRVEDIRGYWGADEFVVGFYGEDLPSAVMIIERILQEFRKFEFEDEKGMTFHATCSAGVAVYPDEHDTLEGLFSLACQRLEHAKRSGRNRIVSHDRKDNVDEQG